MPVAYDSSSHGGAGTLASRAMGAPKMTVRDQIALNRQLREMRRGRSRREFERARRRMMNDWVERAVGEPKGVVLDPQPEEDSAHGA